MYVPSQEQVTAQLKILIPIVGTIATAYGMSKGEAATFTDMLLTAIGPISYGIVAIWAGFSSTRESILRKASKAVAPGVAVPIIQLPKEESALADKLPANVTAATK